MTEGAWLTLDRQSPQPIRMQDLVVQRKFRFGQVWAGLHIEEVELEQRLFLLHMIIFKCFSGSAWTGDFLTFLGSHEEDRPSSSAEHHVSGEDVSQV